MYIYHIGCMYLYMFTIWNVHKYFHSLYMSILKYRLLHYIENIYRTYIYYTAWYIYTLPYTMHIQYVKKHIHM